MTATRYRGLPRQTSQVGYHGEESGCESDDWQRGQWYSIRDMVHARATHSPGEQGFCPAVPFCRTARGSAGVSFSLPSRVARLGNIEPSRIARAPAATPRLDRLNSSIRAEGV